jgi:hypothetical protein
MAAALFGAVHVGMWLSTTYRDDDRGNTGLGVLRADEVTVLTSASDVDWIDKEVERFNKENGKGFHATRLPLLESGVGMEAILKGERQPVIYAPTSPFWIDHLQAAWESAHPRDTLANRDDPATFRTLGRSPLVVLTTADKAPFLASVFGSDHPWDALSRAAIGQLNAPWGKVKFGLADPGGSTVSMLTIGLLARDYASVHGQVVTADLVKSPGFQQYIASLAKANVRDSAIVSAAALERAYATDPTSRDFVMTTEARAMTLCETNPSLRVIYPKETATAEFSAVMLTAPWIHAKAHDGGAAFLAFISQPPAAQDAVAAHIRPLPGDQSDAFIATVKQRASQGFRVDVPTSPVPAYDPMSAAAAEWDSAAK